MKIVFVTDVFHMQMGYLENCLPAHLAMLGHEVHILTSPLPPYYFTGTGNSPLGNFASMSHLEPDTIQEYYGCTLHVLPYGMFARRVFLKGLVKKLKELAPDVVQITTPIGVIALTVAFARMFTPFALFSGNHQGFSTFPVARQNLPWFHPTRLKVWITRTLHGQIIGMITERCYAVTSDCGEVAWRFFGVPKAKVTVVHLGSDTRYFHPVRTDEEKQSRVSMRESFGFAESAIVCLYSGKMDEVRNPRLLADAVLQLRQQGKPFEALFIGVGPQRKEIEGLGFRVLDFMPFQNLAEYYRVADIAVWPGPESISQIDAAGCGIPIIVGDVGHYRDHVDGNGIVYKTGNVTELMRALLELADPELRAKLGEFGSRKIESQFSWASVARMRSRDYGDAVKHLG